VPSSSVGASVFLSISSIASDGLLLGSRDGKLEGRFIDGLVVVVVEVGTELLPSEEGFIEGSMTTEGSCVPSSSVGASVVASDGLLLGSRDGKLGVGTELLPSEEGSIEGSTTTEGSCESSRNVGTGVGDRTGVIVGSSSTRTGGLTRNCGGGLCRLGFNR
jgi:hypothetical protein